MYVCNVILSVELLRYDVNCVCDIMVCCSLQFVLSKLSLGGSEQHRARSAVHQPLLSVLCVFL